MHKMNVATAPTGFKKHIFEKTFSLSEDKVERVWQALQRRETFTKGQIPPYKVEFDADSQHGAFEKGELNIHHGPFLSVHGVIGDVTDHYRDLSYFYGSYVISFRFVRPTRLEFFREEGLIRLKIHCYVKSWFEPIWSLINIIFWSFFGITFLF